MAQVKKPGRGAQVLNEERRWLRSLHSEMIREVEMASFEARHIEERARQLRERLDRAFQKLLKQPA